MTKSKQPKANQAGLKRRSKRSVVVKRWMSGANGSIVSESKTDWLPIPVAILPYSQYRKMKKEIKELRK